MSAPTPRAGVPTRLLLALTDSHLWTALVVASLSEFTALTLELPSAWEPSAIVALATLVIYNLDRVFDLRGGEAPDIRGGWRTALLRAGVALALLLPLLALAPASTMLLVALGTTACSLYGAPLGRAAAPRPRRRLKDLPGVKAWFVGGAVAVATVAVPASYAAQVDGRALPLFLLIGAATLVDAHLFDLRDHERDRARGLATLPVLLGIRRTKWLLATVAALACSGAALLGRHFGLALLPESGVVLAASLLLIASVRAETPRLAYALVVDGMLLLPLAVALLRQLA